MTDELTQVPHEIQRFMEQISSEMQAEYQRIRARAAEDSGTAGDEGEENWRNLFQEWLPAAFPVVTKGRILGSNGELSPQVDVLILHPAYPKKMQNKKTYLAGGVVAAFECKLTLKKEHIGQAAKNSRRIRELLGPNAPTLHGELRSPIIYGLLSHSSVWSAATAANRIDQLLFDELSRDIHPRQALDIVCVSDIASWVNHASVGLAPQHFSLGLDGALRPIAPPPSLPDRITTSYQRWRQTDLDPISPSPFYVLLYRILNRMAKEFPDLRRLAEYWRIAEVPGRSTSGDARRWPISILPDHILEKVKNGSGRTTGDMWDPWNTIII